jgi:uncharacterized repeat protein (TIGR03803 family)
MTKLNAQRACAVFLLYAAMATAAPAQTFDTLVEFDGSNGALPDFMSLIQGTDGSLYGSTFKGGNGGGGVGSGTIFKITPAGALVTLYNFCSQVGCLDGAFPDSGLTQAIDGNLYGTTNQGGSRGSGTVFKITPRGKLTTIHSFCSQANCSDGFFPYAGLVEGTDGEFYGTTAEGGASNDGTVFRITSAGILTTLHSFDGSDGSFPLGTLIQATDGSFYGTTEMGGANNGFCCGTVFRITKGGTLTTLHSFAGIPTDGSNPYGELVQATDGNLYGTTANGGIVNDNGTIFKITLTGTLTTLYNFCLQPDCTDGSSPQAGLVQATDGNLYGTTTYGGDMTCFGGSHPCGTAFQVTLDGTLTPLHSFDGTNGANPYSGLFQATNGIFYGTTGQGGNLGCDAPNGCGTAFSLSTGLGSFVRFVRGAGEVGQTGGILGQGFTGATSVSLNGVPANFTVVSDTYIKATVPTGATTGYATVTTPTGTLTSNVPFHVIP